MYGLRNISKYTPLRWNREDQARRTDGSRVLHRDLDELGEGVGPLSFVY
jgi:hypothetical protein